MTTLEKINGLTGVNDVKQFFEANKLSKLSRKDLRSLLLKLAHLNAIQHLDAYVTLVGDELASRGSGFRFWFPIVISLASLGVAAFPYFKK